jgi:Domain of unknown function (DUF4082)
MKKIFLACCMLAIAITSCKKSSNTEPVIFPEELPHDNFITSVAQNATLQNVTNASQFFEIGVAFKATVKGQIKTLYVKIPDTSSALLVTIWDKNTQVKLFQTNIAVTTANTEKALNITPFNIEKDKEYVISIRTNDYYLRKKNGTTLISYPVISGNIIYTATMSDNSAMQAYPTQAFNQGTYLGDVYFKFQQTN